MAEIVHHGKRKLEEESTVIAGSEPAEEYDSDEYDHDMYVGKSRMNRETRKEYRRQVKESEGFDITRDLDLGVGIGAPIVPARGEENHPIFTEISCLAIDAFNAQNNKRYKFVENVTVTKSTAAEYWCCNTFLAKDFDVPYTVKTFQAKDFDAPYTVKTFQARGFWGICGERIIAFLICITPFVILMLSNISELFLAGDEYPPYINDDYKVRQ